MVVHAHEVLACLTVIAAVTYTLLIGLFLFGTRRTIRADSPQRMTLPARVLPAVSILKPCAGVDDNLESCLETFCALDYPKLEILLGVRDEWDPAFPVLQRVKARHPELEIVIVSTHAGRSRNPKVAQLEVLAARARNELLWIADSNTAVHPDTLTAMVEDLEAPGVGAVVSPIVGTAERTAGAAVENLHLAALITLAGFAVFGLSFARRVAAPGKSCLVRRRSLEAIGGFGELGRYCAEDYMLIEGLRARGERTVLGRHLVANPNSTGTLKRFVDRHTRWSQMHFACAFPTVLGELLFFPMLFALAWWCTAPSLASSTALMGAALLQFTGDLLVLDRLRGSVLATRHLLLVWLRPLLFLALFTRSAFDRRIIWRGHTRWIGAASEIMDVPPYMASVRKLRSMFRDDTGRPSLNGGGL